MNFDIHEIHITGIFESCDCGECDGKAYAAAGPGNGPFGDPFRGTNEFGGIQAWDEYFPS